MIDYHIQMIKSSIINTFYNNNVLNHWSSIQTLLVKYEGIIKLGISIFFLISSYSIIIAAHIINFVI